MNRCSRIANRSLLVGLAAILLAALPGCVGISAPIGKPIDLSVADFAPKIDGGWQFQADGGDTAETVYYAKYLGAGKTRIASTHWDAAAQRFATEEINCVITEAGGNHYLNLEDSPNKYLFVRMQTIEDGRIELWFPESDVFDQLVLAGKLKFQEGASGKVITTGSEELLRLIDEHIDEVYPAKQRVMARRVSPLDVQSNGANDVGQQPPATCPDSAPSP